MSDHINRQLISPVYWLQGEESPSNVGTLQHWIVSCLSLHPCGGPEEHKCGPIPAGCYEGTRIIRNQSQRLLAANPLRSTLDCENLNQEESALILAGVYSSQSQGMRMASLKLGDITSRNQRYTVPRWPRRSYRVRSGKGLYQQRRIWGSLPQKAGWCMHPRAIKPSLFSPQLIRNRGGVGKLLHGSARLDLRIYTGALLLDLEVTHSPCSWSWRLMVLNTTQFLCHQP